MRMRWETTDLLYELFYLQPVRIFAFRCGGGRNREVEFLLGRGFDIVEEICKVGGGLQIYFTVCFHCEISDVV